MWAQEEELRALQARRRELPQVQAVQEREERQVQAVRLAGEREPQQELELLRGLAAQQEE